ARNSNPSMNSAMMRKMRQLAPERKSVYGEGQMFTSSSWDMPSGFGSSLSKTRLDIGSSGLRMMDICLEYSMKTSLSHRTREAARDPKGTAVETPAAAGVSQLALNEKTTCGSFFRFRESLRVPAPLRALR